MKPNAYPGQRRLLSVQPLVHPLPSLDEALRYLALTLDRAVARRACKLWRGHMKARSGLALSRTWTFLEGVKVPLDYLTVLDLIAVRYGERTICPFPLDQLLMLVSEPKLSVDQRFAAAVTFLRLNGVQV